MKHVNNRESALEVIKSLSNLKVNVAFDMDLVPDADVIALANDLLIMWNTHL